MRSRALKANSILKNKKTQLSDCRIVGLSETEEVTTLQQSISIQGLQIT